MLGSIAVSLATNLINNLLWDQKLKREDHKKIRGIKTIISDFNRKFDNTVLDTYAFQQFLDTSNVSSEIYERVFRSYSQIEEPIESFRIRIAQAAIQNVNEQYRERGRAELKDTDTFSKYFDELITVLLNIRNNLMSLEQSAQTSILTDLIHNESDEIKQLLNNKFEVLKEDNIFAEDRINEIKELISLFKYSEANKLISDALEAQEFLSKPQKELIYFEKAMILLNTSKDQNELNDIIKKIKRHNQNSKYIAEINYNIACQNKDKKLLEDSLRHLEEFKYSTEKILLKRVYFELVSDNINKVIEIIAPAGELLDEFQEHHEAHYCYGTALHILGDFIKAYQELLLAFDQHKNIIYKYNALASQFNILLRKENIISDSKKFISQANELIIEFKKIQYIIAYFAEEQKVNYWTFLINLILTVNPKAALGELSNIDEKLCSNPIIRSLKADVYLKNNMPSEAKKILVELWNLLPVNTLNLFIILAADEDWNGIVLKYNQLENTSYKQEPGILALYIKAKGRLENYVTIREELIKLSTQNDVVILRELLEISLENADVELFAKLLVIIEQRKASLFNLELQNIAVLLNHYSKFEETRNLIEDRIQRDENLFSLYVQTFGELDRRSNLLNVANEKSKLLYKNGCRFRVLLGFKAQVEMILDIPRKAIETLEEYRRLFGIDDFYASNYVASKLAKKDYEGLDQEVNYLLNTKNADSHLLVAMLKASQGAWDEAKRIALSALYLSYENLTKEILINFVSMFFSNLDKELKEIDLNEVTINSVVTIKTGDIIRNIAIHSNRAIITNPGEFKFGCENYGPDDAISLILTSLGKRGDIVNLEDGEYQVVHVVYLYAYFHNYCLTQLESVYPQHDYFIMNSAPTPEELLEKIKNTFHVLNKKRDANIWLYNFGIETGLPISFLSGKSIDSYAETIISLLNTRNQHLYAGEVTLYKNKEYVLSLSSIIIMALLGLLDRLEKIANKCVITTEVEKSIREGVKGAQKHAKLDSGVLSLTEDNNIAGCTFNDEDKKNQMSFWTKILLTLSKINKEHVVIDDNGMYEVLAMHLLDEDVSSIELSKKTGRVLVCDDFFVRNIHLGVTKTSDTTNLVGLIVSEGIATFDEIINLTLVLVKRKYLYPFNTLMLCNYITQILRLEDEQTIIAYFDKLKEVYRNILDDVSAPYYAKINHDFLLALNRLNIPAVFAYELLREPLKLKPFLEYSQEKSREFINRILETPLE